MVNVSNAITTEYSYQQVTSQEVTVNSVNNGTVMPQGQGSYLDNNVEENKEISKTPQKDQLVKLCAKYHINFRELFGCDYSTLDETACEKYVKLIESSINPKTGEFDSKKIENIKTIKNLCEQLGVNANIFNNCELENLSSRELQNLADAINLAIKRATTDNKLNKEKAIELARKYNTALMSGYNITELKEKENILNGESINARIERFFGLEKGAFSKLDDAKKTEYIKRYFNGYFQELLTKSKEEGKDLKSVYRLQMRDFGKLLINTPDEDKAIFKAAINSLLADNKLEGVFATKASFRTQKALTAWADSWSVEEKAQLKTPDELGKVISDEDLAAIQVEIGEVQSQEGFEKSHNELYEQVKTLLKKVKNGEELTEQEKLLLAAYKPLYAGENIALVQNEIITDENWKNEFLKQINNDIYEHGADIYKDVMTQIQNVVEKHPEILEMPQEEIVKALDVATNGNYTRVINNEEIIAPQTNNDNSSQEYSTPTFRSELANTTSQPNTTNLYNLSNTIKASSDDNKNNTFTIEKEISNNETNKLSSSEVYELKNSAFRSAANIVTYLKETGESKFTFATDVFKKFGEMGSTTQNWAMNYFSNASSTVQNLFLNKITGSVEGMVAAAKEVDLSKFNLIGVSVTTQKQIDKIEEQRV